jgi:hypothetical protein
LTTARKRARELPVRDIEKYSYESMHRVGMIHRDGTLFCQIHLPFTHRKDYPHGWYEKY